MMKTLERCWDDTWILLGLVPPLNLRAKLMHSYTEMHRFYHTLEHLGECLKLLDEVAHLADRLPEIQIALWFHDAIYDTQRQDNEERSAIWAIESLSSLNARVAQHVHDLVLVTKHDRVIPDADAQLLVDVDLAILGADDWRFDEYEWQVRQEYHWVTEADFRVGRSKILNSFLDRSAIYGTPWLAERLESKARRNLKRSLVSLQSID